MKLRILSDLHLEQNYFEYSYLGEDIVVLAGDIATAKTHDVFEDFIRDIPSNIKIIFITGNHEFYYGIVLKENEFYKQVSKKYENFFFLDKGHIEINHDDKLYSFFGGIMCSDFLLYGELESAKKEAKSFINDFYVSRIAHRTRWSTEDHVKEYMFFGKAFNKWIKDTTIKDSTKICISHFLPSEKSINYKFYQNRLNPYFCSNQEKRVKKVDYWIHGHTHTSCDYMLENTRVICNPLGYGRENKSFDKNLIIDI